MNDSPLHPYIDPELEARVVALVLGEASAFERDELERLIREKPELALFKQRMEEVHGLLTEIGADGAAGGGWKLSSQRRQALLATLTGSDPGDEGGEDGAGIPVLTGHGSGRGRHNVVFWLWRLGAAACVAFGLWLGKGAFFGHSDPREQLSGVDISVPPAEESGAFTRSDGEWRGRDAVTIAREWDKPREGGTTDRDYGIYQPPRREYQRYPGHTGGPNVAEEALRRSQPAASPSKPATGGAVVLADAMGPVSAEGVSEDFTMAGLGDRSSGIVTVTADERRQDEDTREVEFKGNVTLERNGFTLQADSLKVDLKQGFSAGGYVEVEQRTPDGKVQVAKSREATLDPQSGKLALTDFPSLKDGDHLIRGTGETTKLTLNPDGTHTVTGPADYAFDAGQVMDLAKAELPARPNAPGLASQPRPSEDTLSEKANLDGLKAAAKENAPAPPGAPVPAEPFGNTGMRSSNLAATQQEIDAALGIEAKPAENSPLPLGESPEDQFTMIGHGGRDSQGTHWGTITTGQGVAVEGDKLFPAQGYNDLKPEPVPRQQPSMSVTAAGDINVGGIIKNSGSGDVSHFFPILDPRASAAGTPPPAPGSNVAQTSVEGFEYITNGRWSGAKADAPRTDMPGYISMNEVDDDPGALAIKLPEVQLGVGVEWDEKSAPQGEAGQAGAVLDLRAKKKQDSLNPNGPLHPDKDRLTATIDEFILEAPKLSPEGKSMPVTQHGGEAPIELGKDVDMDGFTDVDDWGTQFGANRPRERAMAGESISAPTPATPAIPESRQKELKREEAELMTGAGKPAAQPGSTRTYVSGGTVGTTEGELDELNHPFIVPEAARNFAQIGHGGYDAVHPELLEKSMRDLSSAHETSLSQVESKSKAASPVPAEDFRKVGIAGNISAPPTPAAAPAPAPMGGEQLGAGGPSAVRGYPASSAPAPAQPSRMDREILEAENSMISVQDKADIDELDLMSQKLGELPPAANAPADPSAPVPTASPAPAKGPMGDQVTAAAGIAISRRQERVAKADAASARGEQLLAGQDYEGAVGELKKALDLLPNAAAVANRRDEYEKRYADAAVKLARQRAEEGRLSESMALVTDVLAPKMDPENVEAKQLYEDLNDPEIYNPAVTQEFVEKVKQVDLALKRAQSYIRIGDYDGAERAYNETLNYDKYNSAARRGLEEVSKYRREYYETAYDQNRVRNPQELAEMWDSPIIRYGVGSDVAGPVVDSSDPSEAWLRAYMTNKEAAALEAEGKKAEALAKYKEAQTGFTALTQAHPGWKESMMTYRLQELNQSIQNLQQAAMVSESKPVTPLEQARTLAEEGRIQESIQAVGEILKTDPNNQAAKDLWGDLHDPDFRSPAVTPEFVAKIKAVDAALKKADGYLKVGELEGAERAVGEVLAYDRYNSAAKRIMAEIERKTLESTTPAKPAPKPLSAVPEAMNELRASQEAFSTFSLHVSDVAFKLAQSALASGQWPEAEKVRVEEFVNAFDYGDPTPSREEKVAARLEQAAHPFLQQRNLMRVSLRTASAGRAQQTPLRLTLLLDSSGSMERPDRRASVERAFGLLASQLQPNDQVTLIGFSRQPRLLADRVSGDKAATLVKLVEGIPSEGGTNLEEALRLARTKALEMKTAGAQNRIVLLTDGAANLGNANPSQLGRMIEEMRQEGLAFDAAGVGSDGVNDEILEALTRKGDGRYYLLHRPEDADDGFARQIAGALRPAAQNVKVQVEFNPKRVERYKLLGFEKHLLNKEDFRDDKVDAAELAADEAGVAVYQFEPLPQGEGDIGSISVRFRDMSSGEMVEKRWPIPYESQPPRLEKGAPSLRLAGVAAMFGAKLKGDPLGEVVDLQELSRVMASLPAQVRGFERVKQLEEMIGQARNLEGAR